MTEAYLVSVIIPTYNRADLVVKAIASVQNQSLASSDIEIIVVDDGSEEDIAEMVNSFQDRRVKCIRHSTNLGASEARNTGIRRAKGDYIAFLDSDDIWHEDKLKHQLAAIAQQTAENRDRVVCYGQFEITPSRFLRSSVLPQRGKKTTESVADYLWLAKGEMLTSTLLLSRSLARVVLFKPQLAKHQDLDFVLRLEEQGAKFLFIPQHLAVWSNDPERERISNQANYEVSRHWVESYRGKVSQRAIQGFIVKEIVPKMLLDDNLKLRGIELLKEGYRVRAISLKTYLLAIAKQSIPRHYQSCFKSLLRKLESAIAKSIGKKNFTT